MLVAYESEGIMAKGRDKGGKGKEVKKPKGPKKDKKPK